MASSHTIRAVLPVALLALAVVSAVAQPSRGFNELGVMAFEVKNYPLAQEYLEKALSLEPENKLIRKNLCTVHQAVAGELAGDGKLKDAAARALEGAALDPENPDPLAQAGAYLFKAGIVAEATKHLEAAVALDSDLADARFLLGEIYYRQNKLPQAREQWAEVLKVDPERAGLQEKVAKLDRESAVEKDFNHYAQGQFRLSYAKALSEETRAVVFGVLEDAREDVGAKLAGLVPPGPVLVVLYDGEQFAEATGLAAHVGALYDGKIRAPITGRKGRFLDERTLRVRLTHEYVHVVLVQEVGAGLPWWLNEGLAEAFSREMDRSRERKLRTAYAASRTYPLRELEGSQIDKLDAEALAIAYAQAHAAADYLIRSGSTEKLAALLALLKKGTPAHEALRTAYDVDYAALDAAVAVRYK